MKNVTRSSIAAIALAASASLQLARADSVDLRFHDRNIGVGISVGAPNRYIQIPVAPPACERRTGYWGSNGYRTVWVESDGGYPQRRWENANWQDYRQWEDRRWDGRRDRDDHERFEHEHREHEWHQHDWHEERGHWR